MQKIAIITAALTSVMMTVTAAPAFAAVLDGSFEVQGSTSSQCTGASCPQVPWVVQGRGGFIAEPGFNLYTPAGDYHAYLQSIGTATGSISQTFSLDRGVYDLGFLAAGRNQSGSYSNITYNGALTYDVFFDGISVFSETTVTNTAFAQRLVKGINVATTGLHTLTFASRALASNRDAIAALDNVTMTAAVPEPATWAMMLVGFGMIGAASRYRRRNTATTYA
jgi:hypothetical protein